MQLWTLLLSAKETGSGLTLAWLLEACGDDGDYLLTQQIIVNFNPFV